MFKKLLAAWLFACVALGAAAQDPDHEIHEELRESLKIIESAIISGDYDAMQPVLSEQIRATPVNQEFLSGRAAVSAYFKKWFGAGGYLKKLDMKLTPDALTELSADKNWGVVYGNGVENYGLRDGRPYEIRTRWTAVMAKEGDGRWRVRALHIGTNFLDNPILTEAEHSVVKAASAGLVGGLVVGGLLLWWVRRKKKV